MTSSAVSIKYHSVTNGRQTDRRIPVHSTYTAQSIRVAW